MLLFCNDSQVWIRWAAGVERLALLLDRSLLPAPPRPIYVLLVGEESDHSTVDKMSQLIDSMGYAMRVSEMLRRAGHVVIQKIDESQGASKLRKWMKKALKANAVAAIFVGTDEKSSGTVTLKLLDTEEQKVVPLDGLGECLEKVKS